jgi:hypothetical protein
MNRLITDIEEEEKMQAADMGEPEARKPANKVKKGFLSVISGGFLADEKSHSVPFLLFFTWLSWECFT